MGGGFGVEGGSGMSHILRAVAIGESAVLKSPSLCALQLTDSWGWRTSEARR